MYEIFKEAVSLCMDEKDKYVKSGSFDQIFSRFGPWLGPMGWQMDDVPTQEAVL